MTGDALARVLRDGVRHVPGWPGYYATADGQILSVRRGGRGVLLRPSVHHRTGHLRVKLAAGGGVPRQDHYVHRLVMLAWHGPPPPEIASAGALVLHTDNDPTNNRPDNLTWGTVAENGGDLSARVATEAIASSLFGDADALEGPAHRARHETAQRVCGRLGVYLPDPRWGF
jgi:hypothetical protein